MADCPQCGHDLDTERNNAALADDNEFAYFCPNCGELYREKDVGEVVF